MSESIALVTLTQLEITFLTGLTFLVSFIYSSVGHGGASGYLALMSFFAIPQEQMATSALCLNLMVAGTAFWNFLRASYFSWRLVWPFILTSIPFAFVGGLIKISFSVYSVLLAGVLLFAARRLVLNFKQNAAETIRSPSIFLSLLIGGLIGTLSGTVGVGGGIFLSPLLLLSHWASPKHTAGTSAAFILVNSLAGLSGRMVSHQFQLNYTVTYMMATAFLGGIIGSKLGANHFSGTWLKRILAVVLLIAALKLLRTLPV